MKKIFLLIAAVSFAGSVMAGGLVTNTNHSAYMTRILSRQASTGVDAVYYNPAGLTKLNDGFHFSVNNQTIGQTKTITNDYYFLTEKPTEYVGSVSAPVFPGVYAVFKAGKFAFSAGFNPIGGGGGAEYKTGLPSFEQQIANLVPGLPRPVAEGGANLAALDAGVEGAGFPNPHFSNITGYNADIYFKGSSIYFGYQANFSYEINDMISVAVGGRFVSAKNTYEGYIKDVTITASPDATTGLASPWTGSPGDYLRAIAGTAQAAAIDAVVPNTILGLNGGGAALDVLTNVEADVLEEGTGFTPIVSVNITPIEMLNVAIRYEFHTKLELTTTVYDGKNAGGMFEDGAIKVADMPAMLSVGASLRPMDKLMLAAGANYYFDKNNDYDGSTVDEIVMIDKNFFEYSFGVEYALNKMIRVSAGYSGTSTGVNDEYQSDLRYSLNTSTFGGGFGLTITPMIDINVGGMYTMYDAGSKVTASPVPGLSTTESYDTSTWVIGVGVDLHF